MCHTLGHCLGHDRPLTAHNRRPTRRMTNRSAKSVAPVFSRSRSLGRRLEVPPARCGSLNIISRRILRCPPLRARETGLPSSGRAAGGIIQIRSCVLHLPTASPITQRRLAGCQSRSPADIPWGPYLSFQLYASLQFERHRKCERYIDRVRARETYFGP